MWVIKVNKLMRVRRLLGPGTSMYEYLKTWSTVTRSVYLEESQGWAAVVLLSFGDLQGFVTWWMTAVSSQKIISTTLADTSIVIQGQNIFSYDVTQQQMRTSRVVRMYVLTNSWSRQDDGVVRAAGIFLRYLWNLLRHRWMSKVDSRPPNKTHSCGEVRRTSRKLACKSQTTCSRGKQPEASSKAFIRRTTHEMFVITELFFFLCKLSLG